MTVSFRDSLSVRKNILNSGFSDCYLDVLESYQARAYIIVAIYHADKLWGLLAAYQNDGPRDWQQEEVNLLIHLGTQLGVAVQQAELLRTTQQQAKNLALTLKNLQQAQLQIVQRETMSSLGQFVAGIAHELNNPANFIAGNLPHMKQYGSDLMSLVENYQTTYPYSPSNIAQQTEDIELDYLLEDFPKVLESIESGTSRITELVTSLKRFTRLDESPVKTVDIYEGLEGALKLLQYRLKSWSGESQIQIKKNLEEIPLLECYPALLNQVFLTLLTYTFERLDNQRGSIAAKIQSPILWITSQQISEDRIRFCIADNGSVLEPNKCEQIFSPTNIETSDSLVSGLGLPISHQIITNQHKGTLQYRPSDHGGIEFVVELSIRL